MFLELLADRLDIGLDSAVLGLHLLHFVGSFFKEPEKTLLFFRDVKIFELGHERSDHASHFPKILGLDALQRFLGEIRHLFLCSDAIGHDGLRIGDVDLFD